MCPRSSDPESNDSVVVTVQLIQVRSQIQETNFHNQSAPEKPSLDLQSMKYRYFYFLEERAILAFLYPGSECNAMHDASRFSPFK